MFDDRDPCLWLDELNAEQRAAATHPGGPLLILAGAGTGKTTTLCARVAWLLSEGVPAERILLLTLHAPRGARDGRARARAGRAGRAARGPRRGRHVPLGRAPDGAPARLLARASAPGFGVLDAGDAADLLDLVRQEQGHAASRRRFPRAQTMLDIYSRTVNAQTPLAEVLARVVSVVRGAPRGARRDLPRLRRAQARARRARPRRPAALLARARAPTR